MRMIWLAFGLRKAMQGFANDSVRKCVTGGKGNFMSQTIPIDACVYPHARTEPYTTRLIFKSRGRILFVAVSEIRWIAAEENYVRICTEKETHMLRGTMMSFERKLDPRMFLRVHRSAIVNRQFVKGVATGAKGDFAVHLASGHRIAMSRSYHARLGDLLTSVSGRVA
jgi:DNA-binding LytR/AlgR family response regulator